MTKEKKIISFTWLILNIVLIIYGLYMVLYPWYVSPQARYAFANLRYMSTRANEAGIKNSYNSIHGLKRFRYPMPVVMMNLADLSSNWTYSYLGAAEMISSQAGETFKNNPDDKSNPHDALSRIINDKDVSINKEVYDLLTLHEAVTSDKTELSNPLLKEYNEQTKILENKIEEHYKTYMRVCLERIITGLGLIIISTLTDIILQLFQFLTRKNNEKVFAKARNT